MFTATCFVCNEWTANADTEAAAAKRFLAHYTRKHNDLGHPAPTP